jgi:hypothetical protein
VGGKTGSAETIKGEKTHALFVACAPIEEPVIAVAVVLENAGHGGSIAAPIAGDIMRYYFAHTEEGRGLVRKYNPGIDTINSLRARIWPDDVAEMKKEAAAKVLPERGAFTLPRKPGPREAGSEYDSQTVKSKEIDMSRIKQKDSLSGNVPVTPSSAPAPQDTSSGAAPRE